MSNEKPIPTLLNIAPRGKSWLDGRLVEGEHGHRTWEGMEAAMDRLARFRAHIQRKLEDDIQRVGELVQFAKLNPEDCEWTKQEMDDLDRSIPELRATLDQIRCFELEASQSPGKVGE